MAFAFSHPEMSVGRICVRTVHVAASDESVAAAARRMREADVGALIVVDASRRPLAALTDRDVVLRCVAEGRDPDRTPISAVMTTPIHSVREETPIETALERMAGSASRRLAVVDRDDHLVGILALDDVVDLLVEEATSIGRILEHRHPPREV
jgi:CBS domain-containing protein